MRILIIFVVSFIAIKFFEYYGYATKMDDLEYTEDDPYFNKTMRPKFLKGGK